MKWGLQHVKVTLEESESGEVFVIEQSSDGRVTCVPNRGRSRSAGAATRRRPGDESNARKETGATDDAAKSEGEPAAKPEATARTAARPKPHTRAKPTKPEKTPRGSGGKPGRRATGLTWEPVEDHEYHGFAAPSAAGQFKALISKGSQWALFYELKGTWPKHIGCFRTVAKAKERAQELHDAGWPESDFGPVTAGQVATACPASSTGARGRGNAEENQDVPPVTDEKRPVPRGRRKPRAEEQQDDEPMSDVKLPTPPPAADPANQTDAEKDNTLMQSFRRELASELDDEDD